MTLKSGKMWIMVHDLNAHRFRSLTLTILIESRRVLLIQPLVIPKFYLLTLVSYSCRHNCTNLWMSNSLSRTCNVLYVRFYYGWKCLQCGTWQLSSLCHPQSAGDGNTRLFTIVWDHVFTLKYCFLCVLWLNTL